MGGELLIEATRVHKDGRTTVLQRLPGTKQRPHENAFHTARRVLQTMPQLPEDITFQVHNSRLIEDHKESAALPGITTVYRKHVVDATISLSNERDSVFSQRQGVENGAGALPGKLKQVAPACAWGIGHAPLAKRIKPVSVNNCLLIMIGDKYK